MKKEIRTFTVALMLGAFALSSSGCTFIFQKGRRNDATDQISKLQSDIDELQRAKNELEDRLKNEIADKEVSVQRLQKGLVITFVAEVLFDSGKAELRKESFPKLDKIISVVQSVVPDFNVGI